MSDEKTPRTRIAHNGPVFPGDADDFNAREDTWDGEPRHVRSWLRRLAPGVLLRALRIEQGLEEPPQFS